MIQEQHILNVIADCGIRIGNYSENISALMKEAKKQWQDADNKPLTPFIHTNVVTTNDMGRERITASISVFYPFMFKIPSGTAHSSSLLGVANDKSDIIEDSIRLIESKLQGSFIDVAKNRSVFDVNFSSKYFGQADKAMLANFYIFAYVCDYQLVCLLD